MSDIFSKLAHEEIKFPMEEELQELKEGFGYGEPNNIVVLAIDGTHIEAKKPQKYPFSYYNRHSTFSINIIAIVDHKLRFRGVTYGFGRNHDSRVLRNSDLFEKINLIQNNCKIVGDPAFRCFRENNIIVPETDNYSDENTLLKKQRVRVENCFAIFKGKFKRFSGKVDARETNRDIKILYSSIFFTQFFHK